MSLMEELNEKATRLGVPLSAQLDITWRCNERCVHCYLDHGGEGEMSTGEMKDAIRQLAECGTFFLTISGGEPLLRRDCFELLEYARALRFNVKLKTNAVMIGAPEAARLRRLELEQVQVSIYSHLPEVHDAITKLPGSLRRSLEAIRKMQAEGIKVSITNVLMRGNSADGMAVYELAKEMGVDFHIDPTITPSLDGDRSILQLNIGSEELSDIFHTPEFVGSVGEFCAPVAAVDDSLLDGYSCSAGHTLVYISPSGDIFPCVQFPLPCGNLRRQGLRDIWERSPELVELRGIRIRDLPTCSQCNHAAYCTRCPGLAYMEGNMRGASSADCAKSEARTGTPAWHAAGESGGARTGMNPSAALVQIRPAASPFPSGGD